MQDKIIEQLKISTEQMSQVNAAWLEGSLAENYRDDLSDVDIWFDIKDGNGDEVFGEIEKTLQTFGELDINFDMRHEHQYLHHRVYHVQGMSEYQYFDVLLQHHSRGIVLTRGVEEITVLFDKDNSIRWRDLDRSKLESELQDRAAYLHDFCALGRISIQRHVERGRYLEAYGYYVKWCLMPVVELLRIKYCPTKAGFWIKHIERDLPADVITELESLFQVTSLTDIQQSTKKAAEIIARLNQE